MLLTIFWAVFFLVCPAFILWICSKNKFLDNIGAIVLCYIIGLLIGNVGILPDNIAPLQDTLNMLVIPIALPLIFLVGITFLYIVIKFNQNFIDPFIIFKGNNKKLIFYMLLIGIFPSGLGYIFWYSALNKIGVNKTTFFVYLEPLLTTTLSISFLKEKLMFKHIISAFLIITGLIIFEQYNFILFYYKRFSKNILKSPNKS